MEDAGYKLKVELLPNALTSVTRAVAYRAAGYFSEIPSDGWVTVRELPPLGVLDFLERNGCKLYTKKIRPNGHGS